MQLFSESEIRAVALRWRGDVPHAAQEYAPVEPRERGVLLRRVAASAEARAWVRRVLAERITAHELQRWDEARLLSELQRRLDRRELELWRSRRALYHAEAPRPPAEAAAPVSAPVRRALAATWIEVKLVDLECQPVPNERYRVRLPDGRTVEGRLDYLGRARVDDVEQDGDCQITFPDLDADAWNSEVTCPEEPAVTTPWIEFELLDLAGQPVSGERYRVTFPDGEIHEGYLGQDGKLRYEGMSEGDCTITFPDLDADAWEALPDA